MSVTVNQVRAGYYLDSVELMRLSAVLAERPGVEAAVLMIGTESNRSIMAQASLLTDDGATAGANDLIIAVRAESNAAAASALADAAASLDGARETVTEDRAKPTSLVAALSELPDANLVLISTAAEFAVREARHALALMRNVMIFSDNVSLADELALKRDAQARGLLLMGPDCGTAYIAGTPLAFANAVNPGRIGVVAASGTGLQEFAVLVSRLGFGIRHGIGVGGRDLDDAIGGLSTLHAIDLLEADDQVDRIVLIAKPPGAQTAPKVFDRLARSSKPALACMLGVDAATAPSDVTLTLTIAEAAERSCGAALHAAGVNDRGVIEHIATALDGERHRIHGLYSGGTLCAEADVVLHASGVPLDDRSLLDLGDDAYTVGRPHPMIDPSVRTPYLREALAREDVAVILIDVILGYGAHADPAGAIVDTLADAKAKRPAIVASVCGTDRDPQNRSEQVRRLRDAGVHVGECNAHAAALAAGIVNALRGRD